MVKEGCVGLKRDIVVFHRLHTFLITISGTASYRLPSGILKKIKESGAD